MPCDGLGLGLVYQRKQPRVLSARLRLAWFIQLCMQARRVQQKTTTVSRGFLKTVEDR
jgi:hypothetical protein